ncbi:hypothetical protein [Paenibacillus sp. B2(2019)]|uniref:hypothetical protein n=1 Tax=Paenibacillus sp. B2(2019) TaxID=2607754 RepID=UPI0011F3321F|nr:hypothetical protein [Paenibacillus sp. B2(2019)]KAA1180661.1 hypothetical protein PAENI_25750 [Paenibacillus sp. B2(2019)]
MNSKKSRYPNLAALFQNCLDRGCTPEQLQDFIDRARRQHKDNPEMLRIIDDLEVRYITSLEGVIEHE